MRKVVLATDCFYHVYNRGVDKRTIFLSQGFYSRFLSLLQHCLQFDYPYSLLMQQLEKAKSPEVKQLILANLETKRIAPPLEIIAFCLMPNHFHFTVKQVTEDGISDFMHRVGTGFTNYFNLRENRSGRLFEGTFKAKLIKTEEQLLHLTHYQHINPRSLGGAYHDIRNLINYPWSSLSTYLSTKRTKSDFAFVNPKLVLASFKGPQEYLKFVKAGVDDFEPLRLDEIAIDDDFGWFSKFRALDKERRQNLLNRYLTASLRAKLLKSS